MLQGVRQASQYYLSQVGGDRDEGDDGDYKHDDDGFITIDVFTENTIGNNMFYPPMPAETRLNYVHRVVEVAAEGRHANSLTLDEFNALGA